MCVSKNTQQLVTTQWKTCVTIALAIMFCANHLLHSQCPHLGPERMHIAPNAAGGVETAISFNITACCSCHSLEAAVGKKTNHKTDCFENS